MTYRLVFETTADKRRFVDLAGEEYPSKILDELESAAAVSYLSQSACRPVVVAG